MEPYFWIIRDYFEHKKYIETNRFCNCYYIYGWNPANFFNEISKFHNILDMVF